MRRRSYLCVSRVAVNTSRPFVAYLRTLCLQPEVPVYRRTLESAVWDAIKMESEIDADSTHPNRKLSLRIAPNRSCHLIFRSSTGGIWHCIITELILWFVHLYKLYLLKHSILIDIWLRIQV